MQSLRACNHLLRSARQPLQAAHGLRLSATPATVNVRWATRTPISAADVRKGMVILHNNAYIEITDWAATGQGRQARAYQVSYEDCETGNKQSTKLPTKVTKVECDKHSLQVMYSDSDAKKVVLADAEYNEVELPLSRFGGSSPSDGAQVTVWKDDEVVVKVRVN
mmetsp:Transcript_24181/g.56191  ORF Transcript_24181/g.56191 Transcript_24181/m.56191 type:complete len:165 (+) Transcript_24181:65-559(+)